jgi:hypothetical protein
MTAEAKRGSAKAAAQPIVDEQDMMAPPAKFGLPTLAAADSAKPQDMAAGLADLAKKVAAITPTPPPPPPPPQPVVYSRPTRAFD